MAADQPTGTVTLLFTDIEGSTALLHRLGTARYARLLGRHAALLRQEFERTGGYEVDTEGDSFFVAFASAHAAAEAVTRSQRAMADEEWVDGSTVAVRMGLHTGEPLVVGANYVGIDVHLAARVMAAAHGGQVLLSEATAGLLDGRPLRDLDEHVLKDFEQPLRLFQLELVGLRNDFPPPRTLAPVSSRLPRPANEFVGRRRELRVLAERILDQDVRILTLIGPGGTGKTRLAVQLGHDVSHAFPGGAFFISLAPVSRAEQVPRAVARALGMGEDSRAADVAVNQYLRRRKALLILDNFEHVLDAASVVAEIVREAPAVTVLATSRERLRVSGEAVFEVEPLSTEAGTAGNVADAVSLFAARAAAVDRGFQLDSATIPVVRAICRRVDGLPLAVELAATRLVALPPQKLLERLDERLPVLVGGPRDAEPRQQTMEATIAWSYELLDAAEARVLARLGVFNDGCRGDAASDVCDHDSSVGDVFGPLASLIEKSLVRTRIDPDGEPRYWLLETIREYVLRQLRDRESTAQAHAEHYASLARSAEQAWWNGEFLALQPRLQADAPNLLVAVETFSSLGQPERAIRVIVDSRFLWERSGDFKQVGPVLADLLDQAGTIDPVLLARAHTLLGSMRTAVGDRNRGRTNFEQALAALDGLDSREHALTATLFAHHLFMAWPEEAEHAYERAERALELASASVGDTPLAILAIETKAIAAWFLGRNEETRRLNAEMLALARARGDTRATAVALNLVANQKMLNGEPQAAVALLEEALGLIQDSSLRVSLDYYLRSNLAEALLRCDRAEDARPEFAQAGEHALEFGGPFHVAGCLFGLAASDAELRRDEEAIIEWACADAIGSTTGISRDPSIAELVRTHLTPLRSRAADDFAAAWERGQRLTAEALLGP